MTKAPSAAAPSSSSMAVSTIKAYSVPLVLFLGALFYQVVLIPKVFPPSHYEGNFSLSRICICVYICVCVCIYIYMFAELAFMVCEFVVLGIKKYSSIEEVNEAYEKLASKW